MVTVRKQGGTLIYSPGVRIYIDTEYAGLIDVSADVRDGRLQLNENQLASFSFTLLNHKRKYDGVFTPNDRIHVQMKRIKWLPVFSGYLNSVPYFSVYPRAVPLEASCTLKRLKYTFWDAGTEASAELLRNAGVSGGVFGDGALYGEDGGLRDKVIALLTQVVNWPRSHIHIGGIPGEWRDKIAPLRVALEKEIGFSTSSLGEGGSIGGTSATTYGSRTVGTDIPGTGALPATSGRVNTVNKITGNLELTNPEQGGPGGIGTSSGFKDIWYVQMRWPYRNSDGTPALSSPEVTAAKKWWKNRKILVVNPSNNRGVVLRAVHWGPKESGDYLNHDLSMSEHALKSVLKGSPGDQMEIRFASNDLPLGELDVPQLPTNTQPSTMPVSAFTGGYSSVPAVTPPTINSASGLRFTDRDNLEGHVAAAYDFVKSGWVQTTSIGGYADRTTAKGSPSDHKKGLALDVTTSDAIGKEPRADQVSFGNSVAKWFVSNPNVFKTRYVIWNDKINSGSGWKPYEQDDWRGGNRHPDVTQGHRDHVHISFDASSQTQPGPPGSPFAGADATHLETSIFAPSHPQGTGGLLDPASLWTPTSDPFSSYLTGPRALLNDTPIYETVARLTQASMRSFMAAPNGDFIAWFPDYFGQYGTAGRMLIRDVELINDGFNMTWSDANMVTHQFTAGVFHGFVPGASGPGGQVTQENKLETLGIATVEFKELMEALFNVSDNNERAKYFRSASAILKRFGARVSYEPMNLITGGDAEFWYAVRLFQRAWASQFSSSVSLSFMPEVYPGMLLEFEGIGLQVYVTSVSHNFDFNGGGFTTNVTVVAPSTTDKSGFYGLPLSGPQRKTVGGGGMVSRPI